MNKMRFIIYFLLFGIIFNSSLTAEGWTQKAGSGYYALDFRMLSASKYLDGSGENIEINTIRDLAFNLYSEYGITDLLTVRMNFPFFKSFEADDSESSNNQVDKNNSGVGDLDLGLKYRLFSGNKTSISALLTFGIPISEDNYTENGKFALGDGEFNQIIGIGIGHSLYPLPIYFTGSLKFNNRNEGYSDQVFVSAEGGYKVTKKLLMNLRFNWLKSLKNGDKAIFANQVPIQANNQEYIAIKLGAFYRIYNNLGLSATADFSPLPQN